MADIKGYIPGLGSSMTVTSGDVDPKFAQYITVPITSAQILAAVGTPITIVPAQGANTAVVITDAVFDISAGTAYAAGGAIGLSYGGTATFIQSVGSAVMYGTTGTTVYLAPLNSTNIPTNTAVVLANSSAAFTTGTETMNVNVWYAVIPTNH